MKQYKHTQSQDIVENLGNGYYINIHTKTTIPGKYIENTNDWIEIMAKPEYTILSFKYELNGNIWTLIKNGNYKWNLIQNRKSWMLSSTFYSIHSVRRNSDNVEFTIGDNIQSILGGIKFPFKITNFTLTDTIYAENNISEQAISISNIQKVERLFVTEDNVDIFEGTEVFVIHPATLNTIVGITTTEYSSYKGWLFFSTKKTLEEYILLNKPVLSLNDFIKLKKNHIYSLGAMNTSSYINQLKELVKTKL